MNNPPAFPRTGYINTTHGTLPDGDEVVRHENGMTLRDYFAASVIPALWTTSHDIKNITRDNIVGEAFAIADAMLKAREG